MGFVTNGPNVLVARGPYDGILNLLKYVPFWLEFVDIEEHNGKQEKWGVRKKKKTERGTCLLQKGVQL